MNPILACYKCETQNLVQDSQRGAFACDFCGNKKRKGDFRLRCNKHDFDVCQDCTNKFNGFNNQYNELNAPCEVCKYPLLNATYSKPTKWQCDCCKQKFDKYTALRLRCETHDFDYCGNCSYNKKQELIQQQMINQQQQQQQLQQSALICYKCPTRNFLVDDSNRGAFACDFCSQRFRKGDKRLRCQKHDFDVCQQCSDKFIQFNNLYGQMNISCQVCQNPMENCTYTRNTNWSCDKCKGKFQKYSQLRVRCESHDVDYCGGCCGQIKQDQEAEAYLQKIQEQQRIEHNLKLQQQQQEEINKKEKQLHQQQLNDQQQQQINSQYKNDSQANKWKDTPKVQQPISNQESKKKNNNNKIQKETDYYFHSLVSFCVGGLSLVLAKGCHQSYLNQDVKISDIQKQPVFRPLELLQNLRQKHQQASYIKGTNLREINCGTYFLEGIASNPSRQIYNLDNSKQLIHGSTNLYHINMTIDKDKKITKTTDFKGKETQSVEDFTLSEWNAPMDSPQNHVIIENINATDKSKVIKTVGSYDKVNVDPYENISTLAVGTALTIGIQKRQVGIEVGDKFITYGQAFLDLEKMQVIFRSPKFFIKQKSEYIDNLTNDNSLKIALAFVLVALSGSCIYYAGTSLWKGVKKSLGIKDKKEEK